MMMLMFNHYSYYSDSVGGRQAQDQPGRGGVQSQRHRAARPQHDQVQVPASGGLHRYCLGPVLEHGPRRCGGERQDSERHHYYAAAEAGRDAGARGFRCGGPV